MYNKFKNTVQKLINDSKINTTTWYANTNIFVSKGAL